MAKAAAFLPLEIFEKGLEPPNFVLAPVKTRHPKQTPPPPRKGTLVTSPARVQCNIHMALHSWSLSMLILLQGNAHLISVSFAVVCSIVEMRHQMRGMRS